MISPYGDAAERYRCDLHFTAIVDYMRAFLRQYSMTPVELREAAMLAASMHESEHIRPLVYYLTPDGVKEYDGQSMRASLRLRDLSRRMMER